MAKIDSIFKKETKRTEPHQRRIVKWIHYSKLRDHEDQYCNERNKEEIEALADLIEADGEVLQDLLVCKMDTDTYKIIAGHKRRRACRLLVEERGRDQFAFLPCYVMDVSDVQAEFRLYSSNGYHEKSDYERMRELTRMQYLLTHYPEEFPQVQGGRMVDRLAKLMHMNKTTVGEYLTISKNLGDKGMEKFQEGALKKSAALELAGLPEEKQTELLDQGIVTHAEIKKLKQEAASPKETREEKPDAGASQEDKPDQTDAAIPYVAPRQNTSHQLVSEKYEEPSQKTDLELLKEMLEKAKGTLEQMQKEYRENDVRIRKQKIIIRAFAGIIGDISGEKYPTGKKEGES